MLIKHQKRHLRQSLTIIAIRVPMNAVIETCSSHVCVCDYVALTIQLIRHAIESHSQALRFALLIILIDGRETDPTDIKSLRAITSSHTARNRLVAL